jgi:hypothetical protein
MKRIVYSYVMLIVVLLTACEGVKPTDPNKERKNEAWFYTYEYDSCEYIGTEQRYNSSVLVHKGNCKFCIERSKLN